MSPEQAKVILDYQVGVTRREIATTAKVLAAANVEGLAYKPADKCMDGDALLWHIANSDYALLNGVVSGEFNFGGERPANTQTPSQLAAWYLQNVNNALDKCAAMSPENAARVINFMGAVEQPAVTFLTMATNHSIHHRGQLSAYLRPMGSKVPAIYGMSADENPFEKNAAA
jgi:uncharacterized damage-inducible protein DinB